MSWTPSKYSLIINPYESFMKKHLEHYGYFTGRNVAIARYGFEPKHAGFRQEDSDDSDSENSGDDSDFDLNHPTSKHKSKLDLKSRQRNKLSDNYKWWMKESNLISITQKELEYQREPRWPTEMQVLPEKIYHIYDSPTEPEPYYVKSGLEEMPMARNDALFKTVYYYNPINCGYFIRSRVGGSREGCQKLCLDLPEIEQANTLMFESRFESGNLMKAVKISDHEYDLYLRYDMYTTKHTQWFYFQVKNAKPNVQYRFTICNFLKSESLYNMGMKPLMYSDLDAKYKNVGWRRTGSNIKYYRNNIRSEDENGNVRSLYSLTWTCTFHNENDTYYFAHCYPYTYTMLQDYIKGIQEDPIKSKYCKIKILCRTLAENLVHLITITNPSDTDEEGSTTKKAIVLTARVHPGETNASWMMKGFLDYLLGPTADAKLLRDTFVFKIVPMLNPDGVIIGNYRCSLTGRDLNRNYKTVLKEAFPSVWHTREMIRKVMEEREVLMYCDLHGHSRKNNVFIYGCNNNNTPKKRFLEQVFPMMLSKNARDVFSFKACKYNVQKNKQGTGRIVMWNMGILNSFTMEATFSGSTLNKKAGYHFNVKDLEDIGSSFCDSILDYCDPDQTKVKLIMKEIESQFKEKYRQKLESQGINVDQMNMDDLDKLDINLDEDEGKESSDDYGSDSSVDDGLPLHLERFATLRQRKKRKVKAKKPAVSSAAPAPAPRANVREQVIKIANSKPGGQANTNPTIPVVVPPSTIYESSKESVVNEPLAKVSESSKKLGFSSSASLNTRETEKKPLKQVPSTQSQLPQHPRSARLCTNTMFNERIEERYSQRIIKLQLDTESNQFQTDPNLLTFKYTLPAEIHIPGNYHQHGHLCEHHRKKLNDLFLIRHMKNQADPAKNESDGNASDDEFDPNEEAANGPQQEDASNNNTAGTAAARKVDTAVKPKPPPLYPHQFQHPFRSTSRGNAPNNPVRITRNYNESLLEIKNLNQPEGNNGQTVAGTKSLTNVDEESTLSAFNKNTDTGNRIELKNALDYMPKFVLKQINERRLLNPNILTNINNNVLNNTSALMSPYFTKSTTDIIENANKELNTAMKKSLKLNRVPYSTSISGNVNSINSNNTNSSPSLQNFVAASSNNNSSMINSQQPSGASQTNNKTALKYINRSNMK